MRTNEEIVDILIRVTEERDISISELARRVDMAKSAVSRYFNKTREFPLNRSEDFATALGITPEYLLGFEEEDEGNTNRHIETIAAHIDEDVTEEQMADILDYIDYIKSKHNK